MRWPRLVFAACLVVACGTRDTRFGCSPTPSCSLDRTRFQPPAPLADAGVRACELDEDDDMDEQVEEGPRCAATHVALGRGHTCGLSAAGELYCWGDDGHGQLGGSAFDPDAGMLGLRFALEGGAAVAAGAAHSCAIDGAERVLCWGDNGLGQLDGVPSEASSMPIEAIDGGAPAVTAVTAVTAGQGHTCALLETGVWCWGDAAHGQAGRAVQPEALRPGPVAGTEGAVEISAGARHTCARFEGGGVSCWGELFMDGQLRSTSEPTPVPGLADARALAAGVGFTCALRQSGETVCWGLNGSGQLGDGTFESRTRPVAVRGLELSLAIAAGGGERDGELVGHACALTKSFLVQCWGRNREGQLGRSDPDDNPRATVVQNEFGDDEPFLDNVKALGAGGFHTCAVEEDGEVMCWGEDDKGQLGARGDEPVRFGYPIETRPFRGQF